MTTSMQQGPLHWSYHWLREQACNQTTGARSCTSAGCRAQARACGGGTADVSGGGSSTPALRSSATFSRPASAESCYL